MRVPLTRQITSPRTDRLLAIILGTHTFLLFIPSIAHSPLQNWWPAPLMLLWSFYNAIQLLRRPN